MPRNRNSKNQVIEVRILKIVDSFTRDRAQIMSLINLSSALRLLGRFKILIRFCPVLSTHEVLSRTVLTTKFYPHKRNLHPALSSNSIIIFRIDPVTIRLSRGIVHRYWLGTVIKPLSAQ